MSWCCSQLPFNKIFGNSDKKKVEEADEPESDDSHAGDDLKQNTDKFEPRPIASQNSIAKAWMERVTSRAKKEFSNSKSLEQILTTILKNIHHTEDPVTGPEDDCCTWYGSHNDNKIPVMKIVQGAATQEVSVLRMMVFMFADDEGYQVLQEIYGDKAYALSCKNKSCINFMHIEIPE